MHMDGLMQLITRLKRIGNFDILINTASLVATTGVSAVLGFLYWWVAARKFSAAEVGFAAASISAMTLIGTVCMLGLGTMLIGELPRRPGQRASLISAALIVAGASATIIGALFAILSPYLAADLQLLSSNVGMVILFAAGVGLTAVALVLDQALIGLLSGGLQFSRNTIFGVVKLVALWLAANVLADTTGMSIYNTWLIGNVISFGALTIYIVAGRGISGIAQPEWAVLRSLGWKSLQHHMLNMVILAPGLIMPLIVTAVVSVSANAYFYTAWMLASFVSVGPVSLATVLYAVGSGNPQALAQRLRFTMAAGLVIGLAANLVLFPGGALLLSLFGKAYVAESLWPLRILGLIVFPLIIREHYVAIARIGGQTVHATKLVAVSSVFRLLLATAGAYLGGLVGACLGLLIVETLAALVMTPLVYRTATFDQVAATAPAEQAS
jgi:O-antigen/teichoic acid export membrane protein